MTLSATCSEFELVTVQSGANSLRSRTFGETFHPVVGPMHEAEILHVRQQRLPERAETVDGPFVIWDVGLGAAANAIAVIEALQKSRASIELHSFERDLGALQFALTHASKLPYVQPHIKAIQGLLEVGHTQIGPVWWTLHHDNFRALLRHAPLSAPHSILFDPYSPSSNPELWSLEAFRELRQCLTPDVPCLLTNYTRSTAVRVALLLAGFYVGHGAAVAEKDQTTVASNCLDLLEQPLGSAWLQRARRSTRSAPPRDAGGPGAPIADEDWAAIQAHPQFETVAG